MREDTGDVCPDFPPDFGDLHDEREWWYRACDRVHPGDPHDHCVLALATLDQEYTAIEEFGRRYASRPVIVGTYDKSTWQAEARAPALSDNAPGWLGVDPEVLEALKCDHVRTSPRPAFRWAGSPWWLFCRECHQDLITWSITNIGLHCKRCSRDLTCDEMHNRALIFGSELMIAVVCQRCAKAFDQYPPRAVDAPPPGTVRYAARTYRSSSTAETFARELRGAGVMHSEEDND